MIRRIFIAVSCQIFSTRTTSRGWLSWMDIRCFS